MLGHPPASPSPPRPTMPPSSKSILGKVAFEVVATILLGATFLVLHKHPPHIRGFYCDDETLLHPYTEEPVFPEWLAGLVWVVIVTAILLPIELFRNAVIPRPKNLKLIGETGLPWFVADFYRIFGHFVQGGLITLIITETAKISIGRLRPHFLDLCEVNATACKEHPDKFWAATKEEDGTVDLSGICLENGTFAEDELEEKYHEARLSFMSGHTSTAFYAAVFLIVYLQYRMEGLPLNKMETVRQSIKAFRPLIQVATFAMACWVSFSRISDYFHHPLDVAIGCITGSSVAILTLFYSNIISQPAAFGRHYQQERRVNRGSSPESKDVAPTIDDFTVAASSEEIAMTGDPA